MNFKGLYKDLQQQGYSQVPFLMAPLAVEESVQAFFKFLEQPVHIKSHIDFSVAENHRRGEVGFRHRDPGDHIYNDAKDFFHFHPAIFEKYEDFLNTNPVVDDFMKKAKPIWDLAYTTVRDILKTFEPEFPGVCDKIFDTPCPHILLRFLKYDWQSAGEYLAKPHFDAGSLTLAIAESCPGLRIGKCPETLRLVPHDSENAIFMIASNFKKVMDTDTLFPGWHDVIQLDKSLIGKPFSRWAVVVFLEAHGVEALPRSETHKWYQPVAASSS